MENEATIRPGMRGRAACGAIVTVGVLLASACSTDVPSLGPQYLVTTVPLSYEPILNAVTPTIGSPYASQSSAVGGTPPYQWTLTGGSLPKGLTLAGSGLIHGTPTGSGAYSYTLGVADSVGASAGGEVSGTLNASGATPFDIAPPMLPSYGKNEPLGYEPFVEGGTPPYEFTVTGLPAGVVYDHATGTLSGVPTVSGSFSVTLDVKDSAGNVANGTPLTLSLNIVPPQEVGGDSGTPGGDDGANPSGACTSPVAQLSVSVSASECAACSTIAIVAESPQISAAIAAGKSPCTETDGLSGGPVGCLMEALYVESMGDCGGSACGPYTVDLNEEFFPVSDGAADSITDTVSFCPFDGATFAAIGACASSLPMQCESDGTIKVIITGS